MINLQSLFASFIKANSPQANSASRLGGRARAVAVFVSLCLVIPISKADGGSIHSFTSKDYIKSLLPREEAICLIKLYGKESAFNRLAIGNLNGMTQTYGIPQLKNPLIKDMNEYNQIDYGIKYINHRYNGDACRAWTHWLKKGWH